MIYSFEGWFTPLLAAIGMLFAYSLGRLEGRRAGYSAGFAQGVKIHAFDSLGKEES